MISRDIMIKRELRPCLVHQRSGEYRKAMFHEWNHISQLYGASPLAGGHPAGQVEDTYAIVEFEDGSVSRVRVEDITFLDSGNFFVNEPFDLMEAQLRKAEVNDGK